MMDAKSSDKGGDRVPEVAIDEGTARFAVMGEIERDHEVTVGVKIVENGVIAFGAGTRCGKVFQVNDDRQRFSGRRVWFNHRVIQRLSGCNTLPLAGGLGPDT